MPKALNLSANKSIEPVGLAPAGLTLVSRRLLFVRMCCGISHTIRVPRRLPCLRVCRTRVGRGGEGEER